MIQIVLTSFAFCTVYPFSEKSFLSALLKGKRFGLQKKRILKMLSFIIYFLNLL